MRHRDRKPTTLAAWLLLVFFGLMAAGPVSETGDLHGTIISEDGLPLAWVLVTATHNATGKTFADVSTSAGLYRIGSLPEGKYTIRVEHTLYNTALKKNVRVEADSIRLDFKMSLLSRQDEGRLMSVRPAMVKKGSGGRITGAVAAESSRKESRRYIPPPRFIRPDRMNTEEYARIYENRYLLARENPLSTFSIDVDTASYANVRRFLKNNQVPPKDAVRIEEMINYFDYDYPQPKGKQPFSISTEIGWAPWNRSHQLLHIGLQGKKLLSESLPASNLVFLLDVSGSMRSHDKLPLLKRAFKLLVNELSENDRIAIAVYAGSAGLVLPSTSGDKKDRIIAAFDKLQAGGSTAGGAGIKLAYKVAMENLIRDGNNRIILATDGDFNVGVSSTSELVRLVEEKRSQGVFLTVLGFGTGNVKDSRMEQLANKGNGNYYYIDNILEAKKVFVDEMRGTLFTIAKDVKIQVEFNPAKVKAYRLIGYENRMLKKENFNDDTKDAGELGAGHRVTALYELIPAGSDEEIPGVDQLKYSETKIKSGAFRSNERLTVKLRYKLPDGERSKLITRAVKDKKISGDPSKNFSLSAAVTAFGMLLRDSEYRGKITLEKIVEMAQAARGSDPFGYRSEFVRLLETYQLMKQIDDK